MRIRKATIKDSHHIATYLLWAMEDIVHLFLGEKDTTKAKEFLLHFAERENNQYSYQNCWIAEIDEEVVAVVNIYEGSRLVELRRPVIDYLRTKLHRILHPEDETRAGEYYIDSLAVNPSHQQKGIGSKLLQFLIDEYVNKRNETLGLLVNEDNEIAKRLYQKVGFKKVGNQLLIGKRMEHLQIQKKITD